ncbi:chaplin family protein [Thermomonospora umbrina]|uniref:Small secreted domain DUF320 n=1 Tax=Thermomonospora umbrina TaxID=111806 RepID=A0A3D9SPR7_9ACTN|nr:chaplin family protein [Thermomonospora umbrina]REE97898.1 small secreted domain DUF320 [Thermomonospora umbrina]
MRTWAKGSARTILLAAGFVALGAGTVFPPGAHADAITGGESGILGGNQVNAPTSMPVTVCGNAVAVLGAAHAECRNDGRSSTTPSGDAYTDGRGGVGSGNQLNAPVPSSVDVCGNAVAVGGAATGSCYHGPDTAPGAPRRSTDAATFGDGGDLAGNQALAPVTAPSELCGNAVGVLGSAAAGCLKETLGSGHGMTHGHPGGLDHGLLGQDLPNVPGHPDVPGAARLPQGEQPQGTDLPPGVQVPVPPRGTQVSTRPEVLNGAYPYEVPGLDTPGGIRPASSRAPRVNPVLPEGVQLPTRSETPEIPAVPKGVKVPNAPGDARSVELPPTAPGAVQPLRPEPPKGLKTPEGVEVPTLPGAPEVPAPAVPAVPAGWRAPSAPGMPTVPAPAGPELPGNVQLPARPSTQGDPREVSRPRPAQKATLPQLPAQPPTADVPGLPTLPNVTKVAPVDPTSPLPALPKLPDATVPGGTPSLPNALDGLGLPKAPGAPSGPNAPELPTAPVAPGTPHLQGSLAAPAVPLGHGTSDVHGVLGAPGVPVGQGTSDLRGVLGAPGVPVGQATSDLQGSLGVPAVPLGHGTSDVHGDLGTSGVPVGHGTSDVHRDLRAPGVPARAAGLPAGPGGVGDLDVPVRPGPFGAPETPQGASGSLTPGLPGFLREYRGTRAQTADHMASMPRTGGNFGQPRVLSMARTMPMAGVLPARPPALGVTRAVSFRIPVRPGAGTVTPNGLPNGLGRAPVDPEVPQVRLPALPVQVPVTGSDVVGGVKPPALPDLPKLPVTEMPVTPRTGGQGHRTLPAPAASDRPSTEDPATGGPVSPAGKTPKGIDVGPVASGVNTPAAGGPVGPLLTASGALVPGMPGTPVIGLPTGNAPIGNLPTGNLPTGNAPVGNLPGGNAPAGNAPIGDLPIGNAPTGNLPGGNALTGNLPTGNAPTGDLHGGNAPTGDLPGGNVLGQAGGAAGQAADAAGSAVGDVVQGVGAVPAELNDVRRVAGGEPLLDGRESAGASWLVAVAAMMTTLSALVGLNRRRAVRK